MNQQERRQLAGRTSRLIQATVYIPARVLQYNPGLLEHVREVLHEHSGLGVIDLRVGAVPAQAVSTSQQHILKVAGERLSFELRPVLRAA